MCRLHITTEMLENLGACPEGIDAFVLYTGGDYDVDWTVGEQLILVISSLRCWIGWAVGDLRVAQLWGVRLDHAIYGSTIIDEEQLRDAKTI